MSSAEFLNRFHQADAATRARLEAGCKFINHKIEQLRRRFLTIAAVVVAAGMVWWLSTGVDFRAPLGIGGFLLVIAKVRADRELSRWYKRMVISRVVEAVGNGLSYTQESDFTRDRFRAMDLFDGRVDNFKSEDQIVGRKNEVAFALHEVRATREEKQGKHTRTVTVFRGLIAILEFNKHFHGHTVVVPENESKWLAGLFGSKGARGSKERVTMAHADFENKYTVYSTDHQEAHYLLTPKLIELILQARQRFQGMRLCFYQNSLYVTLPSTRNRFEAKLFGASTSPVAAVEELAEVVGLAEHLVEVLDLETRIWSRA